jgi:group I intron endonuclease
MEGVVYLISNLTNGKQYVGQTWNMDRRLKEHMRGWGCAKLLTAAVLKYGKHSFSCRALYKTDSQYKLDQVEKLMIQLYHTLAPWGYNLAMGGSKGKLGHLAKEKIGNFHRGKILSVETRDKIQQKLLGKKLRPETIEKIRQKAQSKAQANQQVLYVFDAVNHSLVFRDGVGSWDIVHLHNVPYYRLYDSLNHGKTFKLNDRRCYARTFNHPHDDGNLAQVGNRVEIAFLEPAKLDPMLFESVSSASRYLGLGRGVLQYYMKTNRPCSKATVNGMPATISAKYKELVGSIGQQKLVADQDGGLLHVQVHP